METPNDSSSTRSRSVLADVTAMLEDHMDLAALETQYEVEQAGRRSVAFGIIFMLALAAFLLVQVSVIYGLSALGMPVWGACLVMASVYALSAIAIFVRWGRRDARIGPAFAATRREMGETVQWMQKIFS